MYIMVYKTSVIGVVTKNSVCKRSVNNSTFNSIKMKLSKKQASTLYPLGGNIFATVKTWRHSVKIHIRHYTAPTNTKGGRVIPTQRGVALDLKAFERMIKARKRLKMDFNTQVFALSASESTPSVTAKNNSSMDPERLQQRAHPPPAPYTPWTHDMPVYNPHIDPFVLENLLRNPTEKQ